MPIEILMPALSPTMTEGNLAKWLKKEGDHVSPGEVIAEIETDKATMEVEAVDEGKLGKILVKAGTNNVPVNKLIAVLLEEGEKASAADALIKKHEEIEAKQQADVAKQASNNNDAPLEAVAQIAGTGIAPRVTKAPPIPQHSTAKRFDARVKASPLAKRLAKEAGVDVARIQGTGPGGRIVKADIDATLQGAGRVVREDAEFSHAPNNNMRKTIAKRLTESKQQVPHFYLTVDCELDKLLEVRHDLNEAAHKGEDGHPAYKLSVNDLIIKAIALSMKKHPNVNASWYDDATVVYHNVDVSVAVAIPDGLVTPVIRNADQKSLPAISNEMKQLAKRARDGKLPPEAYQGGGFTISNLGMYGIKEFGAIINPPQSCILAVGAGEPRPVVKQGKLEVATVMSVTLSVDHRVVDGALGAEFLASFKCFIEKPVTLLV
jgi:pyruvate dehydrogenase E2 component (dihydrolipoamide acetyltransferase)